MKFIFDNSLLLYLPLYELDGSSFMSKDACGHLCTVTGALWRPDGRSFDGTDDKIVTPTIISASSQKEMTVGGWFNPDTITSDDGIFRVGKNADSGKMAALIYNSKIYAGVNGAWGDVSYAAELGRWTHFGLIYGDSTLWLVVNGVVQDEQSVEASIDFSGANDGIMEVGRYGSGCFDGRIGEIWVYSRYLSPQEIQHNYLATKWRYQ